MKIITCASYYGSGSSALTDLVSEYKSVKDLTNFEFRFLYDLDGVTDLEYHLIECHDRHNAGHALKRFQRLSNFNAGTFFNHRYEDFFQGKYKKITHEYIDKLMELSYPGWWFYDVYDKGVSWYYIIMEYEHILKKVFKGRKSILPNEKIYCAHPSEEQFIKLTQEYVAKLMRKANSEGYPYLEVDQIVPSQNINKVLRYFSDDIYVFVIDRDPRDIYISNRFYWKERICPTDDVNEFCKWFRYTRESGCKEEYDRKKVCHIKFEDLIYKYNEVVAQIETMTGLKSTDHVKQFEKLNPLHSVNNTQLWKKHDTAEEIKVIEENLGEYLYDFESVKGNVIQGIKKEHYNVF